MRQISPNIWMAGQLWLRGWSAVPVLPGYVNTPRGGETRCVLTDPLLTWLYKLTKTNIFLSLLIQLSLKIKNIQCKHSQGKAKPKRANTTCASYGFTKAAHEKFHSQCSMHICTTEQLHITHVHCLVSIIIWFLIAICFMPGINVLFCFKLEIGCFRSLVWMNPPLSGCHRAPIWSCVRR